MNNSCQPWPCATGELAMCKSCERLSNRSGINECTECNTGYELLNRSCWEKATDDGDLVLDSTTASPNAGGDLVLESTTASPNASVSTTGAIGGNLTLKSTTRRAPPVAATLQEEEDLAQEISALRVAGFTCPSGESFAPNPTRLHINCAHWRSARRHSEEMSDSNFFSHDSSSGSSPSDQVRDFGDQLLGQMMAAGLSNPQDVVNLFKSEDGNCRAMLNPSLRSISVGFAENETSEYGYYWTVIFSEADSNVSSDRFCQQAAFVQGASRGEEVEERRIAIGHIRHHLAPVVAKPWLRPLRPGTNPWLEILEDSPEAHTASAAAIEFGVKITES